MVAIAIVPVNAIFTIDVYLLALIPINKVTIRLEIEMMTVACQPSDRPIKLQIMASSVFILIQFVFPTSALSTRPDTYPSAIPAMPPTTGINKV